MLAFLPWLRIEEPLRLGDFHLFPQGSGDTPPEGVESAVSPATVKAVLSQYWESAEEPLRVVTMLQYRGLPLGSVLGPEDRAAVVAFARHLAVAGMSDRRFIGGIGDGYTAAGHYQVIMQAFHDPFIGVINHDFRRKDGRWNVTQGPSHNKFVRPWHLVQQGHPRLDLPVLQALQANHSGPAAGQQHGELEDSVTQFLLANSDSPDVSIEAEGTATYAAIERVCEASQKLKDTQAKLAALLEAADRSQWATGLLHRFGPGCTPSIRHDVVAGWLQDLYALRGNTAHGKASTEMTGAACDAP
jgi:hypothetical protein